MVVDERGQEEEPKYHIDRLDFDTHNLYFKISVMRSNETFSGHASMVRPMIIILRLRVVL